MFRKLPLALALTLSCAGPLVAQPTNAPDLRGLHDLLHLRSDQELAWQAFEQATAPGPQDASRHREAFRRMGSLPSPERMDLSIQMMQSDLDQMKRRAAALATFYAALTPSQQADFDKATAPPPQ